MARIDVPDGDGHGSVTGILAGWLHTSAEGLHAMGLGRCTRSAACPSVSERRCGCVSPNSTSATFD